MDREWILLNPGPANTTASVRGALVMPDLCHRVARYAENARTLRDGMTRLGLEILTPAGARSNILTTFRLPAGVSYPALHDAMKRRGYIIYAGQGEIAKYGFRVANMGTLTPADMRGVVAAFAASLEEPRDR